MHPPTWPSEWLRGVLELCVLRVVADGPTYGYAIAAALEEAGLGTIKGGTLYPLLTRYEKAGLLAPEWRAGDAGPARKYYVLTAAGRDELATTAARWGTFAATVTQHLEPVSTPSITPSGEAVR